MVRVEQEKDINILANLAALLYNTISVLELEKEFYQAILKDNVKFFLKYDNNLPVGFAEISLRYDYVEGSETSPVGYLEGIYVKEAFRGKGYARELLKECENWAKSKGCSEFASDCELSNENSYNFHKAVNFKETNRIICFIKKL